LALAHVAGKRGLELPGLRVRVVGTYDKLKFSRLEVLVGSDAPPDVLEALIADAERVCYVTNTLRQLPKISIEVR
jgi:organic hydroperoxide reductase OsmC/OhrA